jgi:hypothetical protein
VDGKQNSRKTEQHNMRNKKPINAPSDVLLFCFSAVVISQGDEE